MSLSNDAIFGKHFLFICRAKNNRSSFCPTCKRYLEFVPECFSVERKNNIFCDVIENKTSPNCPIIYMYGGQFVVDIEYFRETSSNISSGFWEIVPI